MGGLRAGPGNWISSPQTNALAGLWRLNQGRKTKERGSGIALAPLSSNIRVDRIVPSTHIE
jgi:hypothetical protein